MSKFTEVKAEPKPEAKDESTKTVKSADAAPPASVKPKQIKITVDGVDHVYEAANNAEAWAMHNDKHKTAYTVKQKSPKFEDVK